MNDPSLRLDSLAPSQDASSRRHVKSSGGSGRRRRHTEFAGQESSASLLSKGSRGGSGGSGTQRRTRHSSSANLALKEQQSSSTIGHSNNHHNNDSNYPEDNNHNNNKSYANKYMAAQAIFDEEHRPHASSSSIKRALQSRRPSRRMSSDDGSSGGHQHHPSRRMSSDDGSSGGHRHRHERGSVSPARGQQSQSQPRHLSSKYKSIGRVAGEGRSSGGRRHSIDTSRVTKESMEAGFRSHNNNNNNNNTGDRKNGGVTRSSSSKGPDRSLTATAARLKKVFSADGATAPTPTRPKSKSPARGLEKRGSGKRRSSMIESKTTTAILKPPHTSRLPQLQPTLSGSDESASRPRVSHHPYDRASKTSWDPPKRRASLSLESLDDPDLNSSMPSLAALDLSIHSGKRLSDASILSISTAGDTLSSKPLPSLKNPQLPRLNAPSFSLLFDNAQSHMSSRAIDIGNPTEDDSVFDSVADVYNAAVSVDTSDTGGNSQLSNSKSDESHRSRTSKGTRAMGSNSRGGSSQRRAPSHDDKAVPTRRKKSPAATTTTTTTSSGSRPRSRGASGTRRASSRNSRGNSSDGATPKQRRASMAARVSSKEDRVMARGNSSQSFDKRKDNNDNVPPPQLRRNVTADGILARKSKQPPSSLQRSQTIEGPSRQKSSSSLKSSGSKDSAGRSSRKVKKNRYEASMSKSLSNLEWNVGAVEDFDGDNQTGALTQLSGDKLLKSKRRSSTMSVGSNSVGSRNSRGGSLLKRGPPRRCLSSDSVSLASYDGANVDIHKRSSSATSTDFPPEPRLSDATAWSLADIDLGKEIPTKADPDESVMTPATVSSSSAEEVYDIVTTKKNGTKLRRSKSTGSHQDSTTKGRRSGVQKSASPSSKKSGETRKRRPSKKNVFERPSRVGGDDDADSFQASSHHHEFASRDPLGLMKPETKKPNALALTKSKSNDALEKESFHMTSDFGDFGNDSFTSSGFDESTDFQVF